MEKEYLCKKFPNFFLMKVRCNTCNMYVCTSIQGSKLCWNFWTIYGGQEPSRNRVLVPARQATKADGIDSLESISEHHRSLKIPPRWIAITFPCQTCPRRSLHFYSFLHNILRNFKEKFKNISCHVTNCVQKVLKEVRLGPYFLAKKTDHVNLPRRYYS